MSEGVRAALDALLRHRMLESPEDVRAFDAALIVASERVDATVVLGLLRVLHDGTRQPEVMFGVVHAIEAATPKDEAKVLMASLPAIIGEAREWAETLFIRLLNDGNGGGRKALMGELKKAGGAVAKHARGLLASIEREGGDLAERACAALALLPDA